jgi:hypothetical protein
VFAFFGLGIVELAVLGIAGFIATAVVVLVIVLVSRGKKKVDPDAGLGEDLSGYPTPPRAGTHTLKFEGQAVRLRLVVLASPGRSVQIEPEMAEGLLQSVLHGLGEVADLDRPRVRVWPPQISQEGFAPKFFENIDRPEAHGKPSRWILAAGPAKCGAKTILVGLALQAEESTTRGNVRLDIDDWSHKLRVHVAN